MNNNIDEDRITWLINLINVLSFGIGVQNLDMNNKQIQELQEHLSKQDEQYEEIIRLLREQTILTKGE